MILIGRTLTDEILKTHIIIIRSNYEDSEFLMNSMDQMSKQFSCSCKNKTNEKVDMNTYIYILPSNNPNDNGGIIKIRGEIFLQPNYSFKVNPSAVKYSSKIFGVSQIKKLSIDYGRTQYINDKANVK